MKNITSLSFLGLSAALLLSGCCCLTPSPEVPVYSVQPKAKKLIHFGWAEPKTLAHFKHDLKEFDETCPVDGIGIRPIFQLTRNGKRVNYAIEMAKGAPQMLTKEELAPWVDALKLLKKTKLQHNFIFTGSVLFNADWFDEAGWERSLNNYGMMAWLAHEAGFDGICLDIEAYAHSGRPLMFHPELGHSLVETQAQVRRRAAEWTKCINEQFPGITLFTFFWTSQCNSENKVLGARPSYSELGLQGAFINGVYDAAPDDMKIIDGNEGAGYQAFENKDFPAIMGRYLRWGHAWIDPVNVPKYKRITQMAFALYLDSYIPRPNPSQWQLFTRTDNPAGALYRNIMNCLNNSDEYVWIWAEKGTFWPKITGSSATPFWNTRLPYVVEAIAAAKQPYETAISYAGENILLNSAMNPGDSGASGGPGQVASGIAGWSKYIVNGDIVPENGAAVFKNAGGSCLTQVYRKFKTGEHYLVTARAKGSRGPAQPALGYFFRNAAGKVVRDEVGKASFTNADTDGWTKAVLIFTVPDRTDIVSLTITCGAGGGLDTLDGTFFLDDVEMRKITYPWEK